MTSTSTRNARPSRFGAIRLLGLVGIALVLPTGNLAQQALDICGCAGDPTLRPFNAGDPATYPPGTTGCSSPCTNGTITFALPPDGVLRFSSFTADGQAFTVRVNRNSANTPVTILVAGDFLLREATFCCSDLVVSGNDGSSGNSSGVPGVGGLGGPGGFRGGDAAAEAVNGTTIGGTGLGPGGGAGASATVNAQGGTFFGIPELLPLVGGSGGGGGSGVGATNCTGGGGGGGGGGLLLAVNGSLTLSNGRIFADGGSGGTNSNNGCSTRGAGGSGGAIRFVAGKMVHFGTGSLEAVGGGGVAAGTNGRIRLESIDASAQTAFTANPAAQRVTGPGPLSNPVSPTVRITAVGGQTPPADPQGTYGSIDVVLPAPGVTGVDIATSGVPSGTTVLVTVKPRIGGAPLSATLPLTTCDPAGACTATASFDLAAGAYVVEARATFQVQ
jgi:hypothetical protein